LKYFKNTLLLV